MATQYPNFIDNSGTLPYLVNGVSKVVASDVNIIRDAVVAIQTTLGVNPQSTAGTVDARIDLLEAAVGTSAPTSASYVVLGTNASLSNERVLTFSSAFSTVDSGASAPYTVSLADSGVTADTYNFTTLTVDAKGRITSASTGNPGWSISGSNIQTSLSGNVGIGVTATSKLDLAGDFNFRGIVAPSLAAAGQGKIYFDSTTKKMRLSEDGYAYRDLGSLGGSGSPNKFAVWASDGTISADADFSVDTTLNYIGLGTTATQLFNARKDIAGNALIRVTNTNVNGAAGLEVTGDASAAASGKLMYVADPLYGDHYVTLLGNDLPVIVDATNGNAVNIRSINSASDFALLNVDSNRATLRTNESGSIASVYGTWGRQLFHVAGNLSASPRTGQDGSFLEHTDEFAIAALGAKAGLFVGNESGAQIILGAINQSLSSTAEYSAKYGNPSNYSALGIFHRNGTVDSLGGSLAIGGISNTRGLNVGGIYLEGDDIEYGDGGSTTPVIRSVIESEGDLGITTRSTRLTLNAQSSVLGSGSLDSEIVFSFGGDGSAGAGRRYSDVLSPLSSKEVMRLDSSGKIRLGLGTDAAPNYDVEVTHDVISLTHANGGLIRSDLGKLVLGTTAASQDLLIVNGIGDGASATTAGDIIFGNRMSYSDANVLSGYSLQNTYGRMRNGKFIWGTPSTSVPPQSFYVTSPTSLSLDLASMAGTLEIVSGSRNFNISGLTSTVLATGSSISGGSGRASAVRAVLSSDDNGGSDVALLSGLHAELTGSGLLAANAHGTLVGGNAAVYGKMSSVIGAGFTAVASALIGEISGGSQYNVGVSTHATSNVASYGIGANLTATGASSRFPIGLLAQTATTASSTSLSSLTWEHKAAITGIAHGSDHTAMMTMWSDATQKLRLDLNGLAVANGAGGPAYSFIGQPNTGIGSGGTGFIREQFFPSGASAAASQNKSGAKLQTTTSSTTSFGTNFGTASNKGYVVSVKATAFCTTGTQVGKTASYDLVVSVKNVSGTLTVGTPNTRSIIESGLTCSISVAASGTNIIINAVGQSGQTLDWTAITEVIST